MLASFTLANFKSFELATLPLAELTVLVGANASGKSNLIEALRMLVWLSHGRRLHDLKREIAIRGLESELLHSLDAPIRLGVRIPSGAELGDLSLDLSIGTPQGQPGPSIVAESLSASAIDSTLPLYQAVRDESAQLRVEYNNFKRGGWKPQIMVVDQQAVFTQLTTPARFDARHERAQEVIPKAAELVRATLERVLFLDPVPSVMRTWAYKHEPSLATTGENVAAVLHSLCQSADGKREVLEFVQALPEQQISDITFLDNPRNEVMVQLVESFGQGHTPRDAVLLSDGTLRVLAVAAALLSVPEQSLVVIEELDHGVHPSRAKHLIERIQTVARRRALRVLLTTHNPALMNALSPTALMATVVCHRDQRGLSQLSRLEDLARSPELLAQGGLGDVATSGVLERSMKGTEHTTRANSSRS